MKGYINHDICQNEKGALSSNDQRLAETHMHSGLQVSLSKGRLIRPGPMPGLRMLHSFSDLFCLCPVLVRSTPLLRQIPRASHMLGQLTTPNRMLGIITLCHLFERRLVFYFQSASAKLRLVMLEKLTIGVWTMATLMKAHNNWASRPADERFSSLEDLHAEARRKRFDAASALVSTKELKALAHDGQVILNGATGAQANLTNWSFAQVCRAAAAPPSYIQTLPAELAADCINTGLQAVSSSDKTSMLLERSDDGLTARALTSEKYARIWDVDITERLLELSARGPWQPAPAAFDGSRGLYMGDRDMFAFLVDNNRRIFESLPGGGLSRGFFVWNSEVGAASFGVMRFLYEYVCGNHIVWGAKEVKEIRIRHIGKNAESDAYAQLAVELREYAEGSAAEDELRIERMRNHTIGATKDEVLDSLFGLRVPQLSRKTLAAGYERAVEHSDWYGAPNTAWGMVNGLTEVARDMSNADERVALERASQKVMQLAF